MSSSHPGPPDRLEEALEVDPEDWEARQVYFLLTGLVIPRPIGWISTLGPGGVRNVAPHSYFNAVSHDPPHVIFSTTGVKDTVSNLRELPEFVANIVTADLVEEMNFTSANLPRDEDEFTWTGLEAAPAHRVRPPRVAAAKAHLECEVRDIVVVGNGHVVIGEVVHLHIDPSVWRGGRVDPQLLDPVCRLAGTSYATLGELFKLQRPTWDEVRDLGPHERIPRRA